eukprot:8660602-Karenia_brevis.AAC.1
MSCSFTNQTLAQLDLLRTWKEAKTEEKYKNGVFLLPEELQTLIVLISELDQVCALQACMEGFQVATLEEVVGEIDIFVTTTGKFTIITLDMLRKMKNNA